MASEQRVRPSNWYVADDDAREVVERLIRDAGHDPWSEDLSGARDFLNMGIEPVGGVF
ncbi:MULTISPECIES: hypothetical protein [unclassified Streptomyces]|uniref:Uncharacterized protein n=1 Tax=Streptomyces sp. NBC_00119 TaxID=2975659 RepID=A0AAU1UJE5_9ACTN|nr:MULTISPECIES: hypothetical protein [unclassified Streptomyces]MCX4647547.1 hypothetical protein [Streptomyces sp. NBC_01446]MCX5320125.1 hypothetical protein [Streptomyces sp. NBC_00120]